MSDKLSKKTTPEQGEVLLYQTEDGGTRIEVRMVNETVWMTQDLMTELFQTTPPILPFTLNQFTKKVN